MFIQTFCVSGYTQNRSEQQSGYQASYINAIGLTGDCACPPSSESMYDMPPPGNWIPENTRECNKSNSAMIASQASPVPCYWMSSLKPQTVANVVRPIIRLRT